MKTHKNIVVGSLCALACEFIFGLSYIFTKQITSNISVLALLGWRFLIAFLGMSLLLIFGFLKISLKGKSLKPLFLIALFSPIIYFLGETYGISYTSASESGVFLACIPIASLIASTLLLGKKPKLIQIVGILITLIGVLITIFAVSTSVSFSVIGYIFLLIAVIAYALYSIFVEKAVSYTGAEITFTMLIAGLIVFSILALSEAYINNNLVTLINLPFVDKSFLIAILYQGIACSVIAFFLSNIAIA
ncbi:MAG: DMT family transporter, partial [Christensenellaceae bacterium]|nr:DMT family transporter [Christensenellaceae bacterium]